MNYDEQMMKAWAFDHAPNPKAVTNLENNILLVNEAFVNTFGYTQEEAKGKHPGVLLKNRSLGPTLETEIPHALNSVGYWKGEVFHTSKSGIEKQYVLYVSCIYAPTGEKIGYLGVDI